jgi:hypothetical protein
MTSQSPRIYIYKITFEEVLYYYYGVHKEKKFGEYYMGSPQTHKWCWDFYTPKKQILEIFEFSDCGWKKAQEVETRLIRPFFNADKWCLNESCGGTMSLDVCRKVGQKTYELGIGVHGMTKEERHELGKTIYENGIGLASLSTEDRQKIGSKVGQENFELRRGIFTLTKEELQEIGRKNYEEKNGFHAWTTEERSEFSKRNYENGKGLASLTKEELKENAKRNYENGIGLASMSTEERREIGRKSSLQKWMCFETGYISNAAGLSNYQNKRGIDTSKRVRLS